MTTKDEVRGEFLKEFHLERREDGIATAYDQVGEAMADWWLAKFDTLLAKKREGVEKLDRVGMGGNFGEGYEAGFDKCKELVLSILT